MRTPCRVAASSPPTRRCTTPAGAGIDTPRHVPREVARHHDLLVDQAERLVPGLVRSGLFDAVADLAHPYSVQVVADLCGLPEESREHLIARASAAFNTFGPDNELCRRSWDGLDELYDYATNVATPERLTPGGGAPRSTRRPPTERSNRRRVRGWYWRTPGRAWTPPSTRSPRPCRCSPTIPINGQRSRRSIAANQRHQRGAQDRATRAALHPDHHTSGPPGRCNPAGRRPRRRAVGSGQPRSTAVRRSRPFRHTAQPDRPPQLRAWCPSLCRFDLLREFWLAATGYQAYGEAGQYRSAVPPAGETGQLVFQQVSETGAPTKNRLHLDIVVGDEVESEASRLEALGARRRSDVIVRPEPRGS